MLCFRVATPTMCVGFGQCPQHYCGIGSKRVEYCIYWTRPNYRGVDLPESAGSSVPDGPCCQCRQSVHGNGVGIGTVDLLPTTECKACSGWAEVGCIRWNWVTASPRGLRTDVGRCSTRQQITIRDHYARRATWTWASKQNYIWRKWISQIVIGSSAVVSEKESGLFFYWACYSNVDIYLNWRMFIFTTE